MNDALNKYRSIPFWSWNDELDEEELIKQIDWMHKSGIGGFFMHARGGLTTPYLGDKWFKCVRACLKRAKELDMEAYAYDENGWPSGFAGGKLLEDIANHDTFLTYTLGEYDSNAEASFIIEDDTLIRTTSGHEVLNVFINYSTSTVDILNKDVVKKFIDLTHEQYKKNDIYKNLKGFFTDEPQYYRWGVPFTKALPQYFKEHYNEDIFDRLGLLFLNKKGYRDFRYKYYKALQDLMLNSYAKQIYDWCEQNGYKLTGHYVEENTLHGQMMCCAGVMPFYEYEHIPGCDWLGRNIKNELNPKQIGSTAAQLNKKQVIAETFACAGWDASPSELKHIAEFLMVQGVNLLCQHLVPYSEHGQRKRDYPEHYSIINPWVKKDFKAFNDYFTNLGCRLANSKEIVNVGLFHPMRSCYFNYKKELNKEGYGIKEIEESLDEAINLLGDNHIPFHLIDETILEKHGRVENTELIVGECAYKYIVIPKIIYTMDKNSEVLLRKFIKNGGKVLLFGDRPNYLEGNQYDYSYLTSNVTFDEIISALDFTSPFNPNFRISYRLDDKNKPFFYIVNLADEDDLTLIVKGYKSLKNIDDDKIYPNKIHFDKYQSMIIYPSNEEIGDINELHELTLTGEFVVANKVENYLTLDFVKISKDGINYSPSIYVLGALNNILLERYQGELYLKYEFDIVDVPKKLRALCENCHNLEFKINGHVVSKSSSCYEKDLWCYDIQKHLVKGHNEIVIKINFYESEQVYYALFKEGVLESIKNCLAYDTTIESIYLQGDFALRGDYQPGNKKDTVAANKFEIVKAPTKISQLIKDGFPFFRGDITLEKEIVVDDVNQELVFDKRFQMIDVYVNDVFVERLMFKYRVDLSKHLKLGNNKIKIVLTVSNRNLLGPHHDKNDEPSHVYPLMFERTSTWDKDGNSPSFVKRYAFVKTII